MATITVMPTLWFYNRWQYDTNITKPSITRVVNNVAKAVHEKTGEYYLHFDSSADVLFTENETNTERLFKEPNNSVFVKDAFHDAVINGNNIDALRNKNEGTKMSAVFRLAVEPGTSQHIILRLCDTVIDNPFENAGSVFTQRKQEADEFYQSILSNQNSDIANVQRQAFAGLLWSKQYYHYDIERWLNTGDGITPPTLARKMGRNHEWVYLKNQDIISMPDKWEYPWYASWDTAFHCIALANIDPGFAKHQLILLMREWFMNPEGQMPAYEWNFSDVNPPVHAFATFEVYKIEKEKTGQGDILFLKRVFQKLIINFTWWVNRKDARGNNIFGGGFLGLDNIGVFDRNVHLPDEVTLEQADGTSWMGMYALNMMDIALEIAMTDNAFEDTATKFYEHFVLITDALNGMDLWNDEDKFFYDALLMDDKPPFPLKVRSVVGLIPLFAISIISKSEHDKLDDFKKRVLWYNQYRKTNNLFLPNEDSDDGDDILISMLHTDRLVQILNRLLDESEFLSPGGIRALSKYYEQNPYTVPLDGMEYSIRYDPADSTSGIFGGNSNWRGPVWMPINYLIIRAIKKYGNFYKDNLKVEFPKSSGNFINLEEVASMLAKRVIHIFTKDESGNRPVHGKYNEFYNKPENQDLVLFHEYFHGDNSRGLGASHQTGWTALVTNLIKREA